MVVAAIATGLAAPVLSRITTTSTLSGRYAIWQEAVSQWADKPITGWGPGTFGITVTLGDYFDRNTFAVSLTRSCTARA
ncbi:MAG: hypothetical protein H0W10_06760 [Chloroflexi bacterium]|nr:hypothetical protein [Chloroflexota bacterium]